MTPPAIDFRAYQEVDAVNWSTLKHMAKSPLHYKHAVDHPSADTAGRLKGRGTHTAVLEPDRFLIDYALFKGKRRQGKDWEAFKALHAEENILKREEYDHCIRVAKAVREHPAVKPILAEARREESFEWTDEETSIRCKMRLDMLTDDAIVDLKGVTSTEPRKLAFEVAKMGYHGQLAFYREGIRRLTGRNLHAKLICVEHAAPHDVVVVTLDEDGLYAGWTLVQTLLKRVAECRAMKRWPGRADEETTLDLPAWVWPDDEQVMTAEVVEGENDNAGF